MALKLFNTLTRKKEPFQPLDLKEVKLYTCGPTVYFYTHVGHARTYLFEDILRRVLEYNQYKVKHVMNITDVGHLTSDADEGEDKMDKAAKKEGKSVMEIAQFYTQVFFEDMKKINTLMPHTICKATEHIKEIIELIQRIEKNGYAYLAGGNVYFDIAKFKQYGELAKLKMEGLEAGARIEVDTEKRNPHDFVLWFTESKFKHHLLNWKSPWGEEGYPGWHIECSAMSIKYLGEQFDIHCGGIDHIPVHHTNEIAQSEAATGKHPWVKYWMHGEFLVLDKEKMSKSLGNLVTLSSLQEQGFDPLEYRYLCLNTHYRIPMAFTMEALQAAKNAFSGLKDRILEMKKHPTSKGDTKKYEADFIEDINDDLNMPKALATLWGLVKDDSIGNKEKLDALAKFDQVLGLKLLEVEDVHVPTNIQALIDKRESLRKEKKYAESDAVRKEIEAKGYILEDTKEGVKVKKT
ncbi:MAG TPA: cysteine--tRNA ligase [Candidatus Nanoarchaeia archaeon]|nr:cysteine--tRNA ligase [Candidatus Nanoarchaeia archaeon]